MDCAKVKIARMFHLSMFVEQLRKLAGLITKAPINSGFR